MKAEETGGELSPATIGSPQSTLESKRPLEFPSEASKPPKISKSETGEEEADEGESRAAMSQNPRMQRYLVAVEYVGTRFSGSQQQPNCRTVVGVLEEAFHKFIGQPVSIFCSSRTDAGVHALSNVCHVDVERISKRKPGEVKKEGDVTVIDVRCVPADFHARFKAQERTYYYRLLCGPEPLSTFDNDRAWHVPQDLDILAMKDACRVLVGHHDFSSFRAMACQAKSPIKTLDELSVIEVLPSLYFPSLLERTEMESSDEPNISGLGSYNKISSDGCRPATQNGGFGHRPKHRCYVITARARSFLYHQVRLMVGVLKAVGTGELKASDVQRILDAKTVTAASPMAPACGLYLGNVKYDL